MPRVHTRIEAASDAELLRLPQQLAFLETTANGDCGLGQKGEVREPDAPLLQRSRSLG